RSVNVFPGSGYEHPTDPNEHTFRHLKSLMAPAVSPWAHEAESHARGWVRAFNLVRSDRAKERFDKTAAGELAARVYASAVCFSSMTSSMKDMWAEIRPPLIHSFSPWQNHCARSQRTGRQMAARSRPH